METQSEYALTGQKSTSLQSTNIKHTWFEDVQAIFSGSLFVGIALILYAQAGLLTGSTAGLAFVLHYATGWSFSLIYFVINLPFYWFAWTYVGKEFAIKTFISVALLSLMTYVVPIYLNIEYLHPVFAAIAGGLIIGTGILFLARHKSSLGGANIMSLYAQEKWGISAGKVQIVIDIVVLVLAVFIVPLDKVLWSILAAVVMGGFLALNHRPGRYKGD
jgi:uncharacterized membrane-anchored protein YitT (DUF2179 family)